MRCAWHENASNAATRNILASYWTLLPETGGSTRPTWATRLHFDVQQWSAQYAAASQAFLAVAAAVVVACLTTMVNFFSIVFYTATCVYCFFTSIEMWKLFYPKLE